MTTSEGLVIIGIKSFDTFTLVKAMKYYFDMIKLRVASCRFNQ